MKKYVKPDVIFEDFEMSVGVAACSSIIFNKDGSLKSYDQTDAGIQGIQEDAEVFGSSCTTPMTASFYYNYYGTEEGFAFGS